jgi:hypothetical protein
VRSGETPVLALAFASAFAPAFLSVIPSGNLLLLSPLPFWLPFRAQRGTCCSPPPTLVISTEAERPVLLPLPLPFWLSFRSAAKESASPHLHSRHLDRSGETPLLAFALAFAFLSVIPQGSASALAFALAFALASEIGPGFSPDINKPPIGGL